MAAGALALFAFNGAMMLLPNLLRRAIDALAAGEAARVGTIALGMAGVAVAAAGIRLASRVFMFFSARDIEYDLRRDLFAKLIALPPSYFARRSTGDVMSRLTSDLASVRSLIGPVTLNLANTVFAYSLAMWRLLSISPRLTLVGLLPFPLLLGAAQLYGRRIFRHARATQERLGELSATLQEDLAGIQVVKSFAVEGARDERFRRANQAWLDEALGLARARSALMPMMGMGAGLGGLVVLWVGGHEVIAMREGGLTLARLVEFNALLGLLAWPTLALGFMLAVYQRGRASWARLAEVLAEEPAIADRPGLVARAEPIEGRVELRGLAVAGRLSGASLVVPAGATVAFVGRTGGGKSTIADALLRLLEIAPGQVFLDGADVHDLPLAAVRGAVGYAPQEAFLFSTTIARNIAFGFADTMPEDPAADPRVLAAARAAGLERDLAALPDGIRTVVGERGITLSGGQRQRVALARALVRDPPVLLLDDSLSSVDAETERAILGELRALRAGRTTLIISHRVAAVRDASEIVVLDGGRIAERGPHDDLVARGGIYADLYRSQLLEAEVERLEPAAEASA